MSSLTISPLTSQATEAYLTLVEFVLVTKQHVIAASAQFDLTSMQAITLLLIQQTPPRPMNVICRLYGCDASNVTGIIDGLEQKGLVSRQPDPHDRRTKMIHLEPAGVTMKQHIFEILASRDVKLFGNLNPAEIEQFLYYLQKIVHTETVS
jgi:DNA-binding MarR family transcriptional regulator